MNIFHLNDLRRQAEHAAETNQGPRARAGRGERLVNRAEIICRCIADQVGVAFCPEAGTFGEMGVSAPEMLELVDHVNAAAGIEIPYAAFNAFDMLGWTIERFVEFALRYVKPTSVPDEL